MQAQKTKRVKTDAFLYIRETHKSKQHMYKHWDFVEQIANGAKAWPPLAECMQPWPLKGWMDLPNVCTL